MGGMCARVCPTEELCEEACVREAAEGKPVRIGQLQRYAVDAQIATGRQPFTRGAPKGKRVAVVGAGPAGLACAHALAIAGYDATIFEARAKAVETLRRCGQRSTELMRKVAKAQRDPDPGVRCRAAETLIEAGAPDRVSTALLIEDLKKDEDTARCAEDVLSPRAFLTRMSCTP